MWFSTGSGRIELQLTLEQARSASHSGQCDNDIAALRTVPAIKRQLDKLDPALLSKELKEWGCWDETERADHEDNLNRILWIAACAIRETYYTKER